MYPCVGVLCQATAGLVATSPGQCAVPGLVATASAQLVPGLRPQPSAAPGAIPQVDLGDSIFARLRQVRP